MHGNWLPEEEAWIAAIGTGCNLRTFPWEKCARIFSANFPSANTRGVSPRYHKNLKRRPEVVALDKFLASGHPRWQVDEEHAEHIWEATQILNVLDPEWRCEIP